MSLKFILGTASYDHHQALVTNLKATFQEKPQERYFYLVPNHIKFESEVSILEALKSDENDYVAASQIQVFSLTRLAWYFMKNTPYYQIPRISTAGLNMLVFRLLQEHQEQLQLFRGEVRHTGFVAQLTKQLLELKIGCITPADLTAMAENLGDQQVELAKKLHDLTIIATAFEAAMQKRFIENTALIDALTLFLQQQTLTDCHFYVEGFAQFTAQEQALLTTLMQQSEVQIGLILDRAYPNQQPDGLNFFFQAGRTYYNLYQQARLNHVPVMMDQMADSQRLTPALAALDQFWVSSESPGNRKLSPVPVADHLHVVAAENRYAELRYVAREIQRLVQTGHYRYRDFLILTRHLAPYQTMIAPILTEYEIPYFCDLPQTMAAHPLVSLLEKLLDVNLHFYRYEDVMALLKTELLIPKGMSIAEFRADLDLCENLILKNGYEGKDWLNDFDWQFYRFGSYQEGTRTTQDEALTERINGIRRYVQATLPPFYRALKAAKTGRQVVQVLYQFLIDHGVDRQLLHWRDQALAANQVAQAGQPEQTWSTFMQMLDEYVTLLGDVSFEEDNTEQLNEFKQLLSAGFAAAQYAQIPSTLDQVVLSESGMVQTKKRQITFMIGSTDQVMPDQIENTALLTDQDRQRLLDNEGQVTPLLNESSVGKMNAEPYLNYLAFLSSQTTVYFTYPLGNGEGTAFKISPYVERIRNHFDLTIQKIAAEQSLQSTETPQGSWRSLLSDLIQVSRQAQENQTLIPEQWLTTYRLLQQAPQSQFLTTQLFQSLNYRNEPERLTPEIVTGLYGNEIHTSISKLEEFYQNQYAYFLKYGLKLQERPVFELTPANTGNFYHEVMDRFIKLIQGQQIALPELDDQQIDKLVSEVLAKTYEQPEFKILNKTARMGYIRQQLMQTVKRVTLALRNQSLSTNLRPLATEVLFGQVGAEKGLQGLNFMLDDHREVKVRGKIDRIDQLTINNQPYLGIVDYKSSQHSFNFRDAYYGLALQMLTYLETVLQDQQAILPANSAVKPAGAFYLHLKNPTLTLKQLTKKKMGQLQKGEFDQMLLDQFKYNGLIVNDEELLENLDTTLVNGQSPLFAFSKLKSGKFSSKQLVTLDQLDLLMAHNEDLIKEAGQAIFAGDTALNPIMRPDRTNALTLSPFKSIFQFDAMLPENNYRQLEALDEKAVLERLMSKKGDGNLE
ncbi:PD-(D/E)XK nuclease family protein [Latilactobacillus sakei]|uniref:PD-(D/E)XK nuclease family protein n=1 Tax=Latilactobacillus sakei TaxID=1599 RepID=UPI000C1274CC|nr:PD-(D/E)XK nuclease family protein [Latilactobacillus sakei]PKX61753.1 ATP-dependent helicase [Latilactobacillus sakei]PKX69882.1 ATP-dependent helicase [Latilactobacillus sakei]RFN55966.1 ATP-dependent helicase [Latilactobacillus sakei]UNC18209.1 ATP-dependent helicase [Latilactobacillus sakei]SON69067.1 ATP-dependent helicase/deoxyribonuclease subunit B [Latilactobacillus sakei]